MNKTEKTTELRQLIDMLLDLITDERKLEEIYMILNRLFCR